MFYCPLHNWYSSEEPCKACHPMQTTTLATMVINTEGTSETQAGTGKANDVGNEKDWEIVAFRMIDHDIIIKKDNGRFNGYTEASFLNDPVNSVKAGDVIIHSVRRKDGGVFTIGDEVEYRSCEAETFDKCWPGKINKITLDSYDKNKLSFEIDDNNEWNDRHFPHKHIENIRHKKPQPDTKERIEVRIPYLGDTTVGYANWAFSVHAKDRIDQDGLLKIKQAIEAVLNNDLAYCIGRLVEELKKDKSEGSYYHSWQANIAVAVQDEYNKVKERFRVMGGFPDDFRPNIYDISNDAAKRFLDLLCYVPAPESYPNKNILK